MTSNQFSAPPYDLKDSTNPIYPSGRVVQAFEIYLPVPTIEIIEDNQLNLNAQEEAVGKSHADGERIVAEDHIAKILSGPVAIKMSSALDAKLRKASDYDCVEDLTVQSNYNTNPVYVDCDAHNVRPELNLPPMEGYQISEYSSTSESSYRMSEYKSIYES